MVKVTRQYRFSASHRLHSPQLSDDENRQVYGKCNNPYGHGHDYVVQVQVSGPVDEDTGLALPVEVLDGLMERLVLRDVANGNLNDLPAFAEVVPTTEMLAIEVDRRLRARWSAVFPETWPQLDGVRILETKRNVFETIGARI
ncbi:MAG: 6-carboxytetrahydropterin synthase [Bryobacterales bacterium]|nr:6-carboxytetrahydropterin synthase [Bryobacterales bacterium]